MKAIFLLVLTTLLFADTPDTRIPTNKVIFGKKASGTKILEAETAAGAANPKIQYNSSTSRWEFANDGSTYSAFGSGSGGSGGINLLTNGNFEAGTTEWSASAGTFATTTTAANVGNGLAAGSWTPAASSNTLTTSQKTIVSGLYSRNCLAKVLYKKTANNADHTLQVIDGSSNVLASVALGQAATYQQAAASFVCPSSSTVALRVLAGGTDQIFIDEAHLGENFMVGQISNATLAGGATWPIAASCAWTATASSYANFSADSDCTTPTGSNLQGNAIAPATKVPGIRFSSLPPGRYLILATGAFLRANTGGARGSFIFSDGTNSSQANLIQSGASNDIVVGSITGWITYTAAQSDTTIQIQAKNTDASTQVGVYASDAPLDIQVYRFPLSQDTALRVDQTGWFVSANISGANPSLGTSNVSSYTGITNGSLTMVQNSGSLAVQIPCSSTNASSGLTCSSGSESVGVVYNQPVAGPVRACVSFSHEIDVAQGTRAISVFQIVETGNANQTIVTEGGARVASGHNMGSGDQSAVVNLPNRVCGEFNFTSAGQKTLRLMYEQLVTGTPNAVSIAGDADATEGQRDIHWDIQPIGQLAANPIIVGSVSSNGTGPWRSEASYLVNNGSTCTVSSQTGSWLSSCTRNGAGDITMTIAAGAFSATPVCVCTAYGAGARICGVLTSTTPSSTVYRFKTEDASASSVDVDVNVYCMGAR